MDHRTRMSRIRAAVRAERGRREKRAIAGLSCICAMLCAAVSVLIRQEMGPGDFIVQESYGAVLLRGSQNACFMTALLAFLTGTVFTLLCIEGEALTSRMIGLIAGSLSLENIEVRMFRQIKGNEKLVIGLNTEDIDDAKDIIMGV